MKTTIIFTDEFIATLVNKDGDFVTQVVLTQGCVTTTYHNAIYRRVGETTVFEEAA